MTGSRESGNFRVFLTGASSGIGRALARHYAQQGVHVGLVSRREEALQALAAELPGDHLILPADVGDARALQTAAAAFIDRFGCPDIVIANAGVSVGTLAECAEDLQTFETVLRINLLGMAATFQPFIVAMRARGSGRLAGIASVAGIRGLPGAGAYSASKAAAIAYLESLRVEMHDSGVRVVTIAPGYIETPMTAVNSYPMPFMIKADTAARRIAQVIEKGSSYAVIPWQMGIAAKLLRMLPNAVFDAFFSRTGRKPRGLPM